MDNNVKTVAETTKSAYDISKWLVQNPTVIVLAGLAAIVIIKKI